MTFGKDEHPGRVRGVLARYHWSSYFGRAPYPHGREKCANVAREAAVQAVATLGAAWRDFVAEHGDNTDSTAWLNKIFSVPSKQTTPIPTTSLGDEDPDPTPARKNRRSASKAVPPPSTRQYSSKAIPTPSTSTSAPTQAAHTPLGRLEALKDAYLGSNEVQGLTIPATSIGVPVTDPFSVDDVTDIGRPTTWLSGQWMHIALNELFLLCQARGHRHICFTSTTFTHEGVSNSHASRYIRDRLQAEGDVMFCPVSMDAHWALVVIFKATDRAYLFDSANNSLLNTLPSRVKDHFKMVREVCGRWSRSTMDAKAVTSTTGHLEMRLCGV